MPTDHPGPLQRFPQPEVAEIPALKRRTLALYRDILAREALSAGMDRAGLTERRHQLLRTDGRRGVEVLVQECCELVASGATHQEIAELLMFVARAADDAFMARDGRHLPSLIEAELAEAEGDVQEDLSQPDTIRILAKGKHLTTAEMEERSAKLRKQAASSSVALRVYEGEMRRRALGLYDRRTA